MVPLDRSPAHFCPAVPLPRCPAAEQHRQIEHLRPRNLRPLRSLQQIVSSDDLIQRAEAHPGEMVAYFFCEQAEIGDHLLRCSLEFLSQILTLRGNTGGAGVDMA